MAGYVTNRAKFRMVDRLFNYGSSPAPTGFGMLLLGGTTPASLAGSARTLNTVADLLALPSVQELNATGYARQSLSSLTVTEDDTNHRARVDCANVSFGSLGGATNDTIKGCAVYEAGSSDATRLLLVVVDGKSLLTNGSGVTVEVNDFLVVMDF